MLLIIEIYLKIESKNIFICMQRWFRALPQVSRNMMNLNQYVGSENLAKAMKDIKKYCRKWNLIRLKVYLSSCQINLMQNHMKKH